MIRAYGAPASTAPHSGAVSLPPTAEATPTANGQRPQRQRRFRPYLVSFLVYQVLALIAWWHLVASGVGGTVPAGSADPGQEVWFLAWLPHALGDATNPFLSHALFAPAGVNLLSNTSMDLLGILFAPVTATAGPVASLDLASIAAPAISALGAFALCRRYVSWPPAAFAGGLCYGFGPFLATDLRYGHLDLTWLVLPPLIFVALDELLVRQRRRPEATGAVLGGLVVLQFFVSTEMLAVTLLTAAVALMLSAVCRPRAAVGRLHAALPGMATAVGLSVALLAYPVWTIVAGPRHVEGAVWPDIGQIAASVAASVQPHAELAGVAFISGGNGSYLGVTLLVVLTGGAVAYWRSVPLRLSLALVVACYVASLGYDLHVGRSGLHVLLPAAVLGHIPLLDSLVPARFAAMVDLFAGVALAIIVDHLRRSARPAPRAPGLIAGSVAVVALVPILLLPPWPYATASTHQISQPVALRSLAARADRGGSGRPPTVVVYPDSPSAVSDQMVWQAEDGFSFRLADGYAIVPGPGGRAIQTPPVDGLWLVLAAGSLDRLRLPLPPGTAASLRASLRSVDADEVVVLPGAVGSSAVRGAFTAALGRPTRSVHGAAEWSLPRP